MEGIDAVKHTKICQYHFVSCMQPSQLALQWQIGKTVSQYKDPKGNRKDNTCSLVNGPNEIAFS